MTEFRPSIVEYYSKQKSNHCGYCSSKDGSLTYGLYAHTLKVEDYQNLIDRGWRRCGKYCYKSIMDCSCCPLYTIRCEAKDFKLSKTQKKILKRFNNFLIHGTISKVKIAKNAELPQPSYTNFLDSVLQKAEDNLLTVTQSATSSFIYTNDRQDLVEMRREVNSKLREPIKLKSSNKDEPKKNEKNKCLKAKFLRIERKKQKLIKLGLSEAEIEKKLVEKKKYPVVKTIEDYLNEPFLKQQIHNLKITLVRSFPKSSEFDKTFSVSFDLYKRYQMLIHNDPPEKLTQHQFEKFLVVSPLQALDGYGSYHQQYWLDNKLIAVGVIDILPKCLSSVYFFYDPDYAHLSLGTYGALREVEFTRKLSNSYPDLVHYYMGFYIHSCVKMKYKGAFKPSFLLCPEVYTWHPIKECLPKLDVSKYSRFNEDPLATDFNSKISFLEILILYNRVPMPLVYYLKQKKCDEEEQSEIMEYAQLVGNNCAQNMLLFRM